MARLRGKRWITSITTPDGTRLRPTFATQREAEDWEAEARLAITEGRPVPSPKTGLAKGKSAPDKLRTLGGLFDYVSRTEWDQQRAGYASIRNGKSVVDYLGANRSPDSISTVDVAEMKVHYANQGLSPSTVNKRVAALSKMLRVGLEAGVVNKMPRIKWNQEVQTKFRYLDQDEEEALLAYWKLDGQHDMHDLCALLIDTGARCFTEMLPVQWDHFGPNFSTVTFWHTKTNRPRTVPLTHRSREILRARQARYPGTSGPFQGRINKNAMRSKWDTMRAALGFHDVTPHTLRHTCCTRLVLGGVDVKRVMTWMGHGAIVTTMRYMQLKPTGLEDVLHVLEDTPKLKVVG